MSPEQATGGALDGRSDIYSLGLVGFCALSGRLPFRGDSLGSILAQRISGPAPKLHTVAAGVSPRLATVIDRCLATAREERYQTGEALAEALDASFERPRRLPATLERWVRGVAQLPFAVALVAPLVLQELLKQLAFLGDSFYPPLAPDRPSQAFEQFPWLVYVCYLGMPLVVYATHRLGEVRKVRRDGFGVDDFRAALISELARHRDGFVRMAAQARWLVRFRDAAPGILCVVLGLTAFHKCSPQIDNDGPFISWLLWLILTGVVVVVRLGRKAGRPVEVVDLEARAFFWKRWPGAMVAWLAGLGLKKPTSSPATHQPTEVALGGAATLLFAALPRDVRRDLSSVPGVIARLEERAQTLRRQIDELQALESNWPSPRAAGTSPEHQSRDESVASLRRQRERAHQGLTDVVMALEKVRMALLRLHGGSARSVEITDDIAAADEVCRSLDAATAGHAEVERLLRPQDVATPAAQRL